MGPLEIYLIEVADDALGFFFFQAEDGIRDGHVTGVQTCALPISRAWPRAPAPCWSAASRRRERRPTSSAWRTSACRSARTRTPERRATRSAGAETRRRAPR